MYYSTINTVPFATQWYSLDPNDRVNKGFQCIFIMTENTCTSLEKLPCMHQPDLVDLCQDHSSNIHFQ